MAPDLVDVIVGVGLTAVLAVTGWSLRYILEDLRSRIGTPDGDENTTLVTMLNDTAAEVRAMRGELLGHDIELGEVRDIASSAQATARLAQATADQAHKRIDEIVESRR